MDRYERGSGALPAFSLSLLAASVISIGIAIGRILEDGDGRVHDVQISNEQLHQQLDPVHHVGQLVLNDEKRTFTFNRRDPGGNIETCTGRYEQKEGFAQVVGDLVCSQPEPAIPK